MNVPDGYIAKYRGYTVIGIDVDTYFNGKEDYDKETDFVFGVKKDDLIVLVLRGRPIGVLNKDHSITYANGKKLDDYFPLETYAHRRKQRLEEDNATKWVLKEMERISPKDYKGTYYTCAAMQLDKPSRVIHVILPVNEYQVGNMGYEIMPVAQLAKYCPWDMTRTLVTIHSKHTNIDHENLHDLVVEDAEVHKHLSALEGGE